MRFRTPKNVPSTFPITPLPLLTPVAQALPLDDVCDLNPIEQHHIPSGSTSVPSLTLSSSSASSRVLTPTEQTDPQKRSSLPLMPNPSPAPLDGTTQNLDASFLHPNHARVYEWESALDLAIPVRPAVSLWANELGANSNGRGGPFPSPREGPLPPQSFPVYAAQQRVSDLPPELYELISAVLVKRN